MDFVSTNPLPLQAFLPLQSFWALLQAPLPLHSLSPAHLIMLSVALAWPIAVTLPARTIVATAVAIVIPLLTGCMARPPCSTCTVRAEHSSLSRYTRVGIGPCQHGVNSCAVRPGR